MRRNLVKKFIIFFILSLIITGPRSTIAASIKTAGSGSILTTLTPENPGPNQKVIVNLNSPDMSLDYSDIVWVVNGARLDNKTKSLSFNTGGVGSITHIEATVTTKNPNRINPEVTKILILVPIGDVDLLWEANTSVPFFYQGKALANNISPIKVAALPEFKNAQGQTITKENLVFNWTKNGQKITSASGAGKDILIFNPSSDNNHTVSVEVKTLPNVNPQISVEKTINIAATSPKLYFYFQHPLQGTLFNQTVKAKTTMTADEVSVRAEPFFLAKTSQGNGLMSFNWQINNKPVAASAGSGNTLILRQPENQSGFSNINLTASDNTGSATNGFTIYFNPLNNF